MKIVYAATPEQDEKVNELVGYFYSTIFPQYFSDEEIRQFLQQKVLRNKVCQDQEAFDTLGDAYKAITSLQTIISIIEFDGHQSDYKPIFEKNVSLLSEIGFYFPFSYEQFVNGEQMVRLEMLSIFSKPANQFLI